MADKMGTGSFLTLQGAINTLTAEMDDVELQRLQNSTTERLVHKHQSNDVEKIRSHYDSEISQIRNDMRACDDKTSEEYMDLMSEIEELQQEKDAKVTKAESEANDRSEELEQQDVSLETRFNAMKEDRDGLKEALEQSVKRQ